MSQIYLSINGSYALPASAITESRSQSYQPLWWWNKVNSIELNRGLKPDEACLLLEESAATALDTSTAYDIILTHESGTLTTKKWYLTKMEAATNGTNKIYFCQFQDGRCFDKIAAIGKTPSAILGTHRITPLYDSQPAAVTWQTVLNTLWALLPTPAKGASGSAPTLAYTPVSNAENLTFEGVNTWRAILQSCLASGNIPIHDPTNDTFKFVDINGTQSGLAALIAANTADIIYEGFIPVSNGTRYPANVTIVFPPCAESNTKEVWYGTPDESTVATGAAGATAGTSISIIDTTRKEESNSTQRTNRKTDLANLIKGTSKAASSRMCKSYSKFIQFLPGEEITKVIWKAESKRVFTRIEYTSDFDFDLPGAYPRMPFRINGTFHAKTPPGGIPAVTGTGPWLPGSATCTLCEAYIDGGLRKIREVSPTVNIVILNDQDTAIAGSSLIEAKIINGDPYVDVGPCAI